jgi:hypothetical protein
VGKTLFYWSKFGANLNPFENRIGRTVLRTPPVSAVSTASSRCLTPHLAADNRAPVASQTTCQPRRPASRRPRRPPLSRRAQGPLSPSLSLSLLFCLNVVPTPPPPSSPLPLKQSRRSPAEIFSPPRAIHLIRPHLSAAPSSPSPSHPLRQSVIVICPLLVSAL